MLAEQRWLVPVLIDLELTETDLEPARSTSINPRVSSSQVIDVTLMVVVGMLACQDDEVDAAIATPQVQSICWVRGSGALDASSL